MEKVGYFTEMARSEDLYFFQLVDQHNFKYVHIMEAMGYYFEYPSTVKEVFKKWRDSVKINIQYQIAFGGFYCRFLKNICFCIVAMISLILCFIDLKWATLFLLLVVLRAVPRIRLHKKLSSYFFKRPYLWPQLLILFLVLDIARISGVVNRHRRSSEKL